MMNLSSIELKLKGAQIGSALYVDGEYYLTYTSMHEFVIDMVYHFNVKELDELFERFNITTNVKLDPPFKYRGVCSELWEPIDDISRYVCYANSLGEIIKHFEFHEKRALKFPDIFTFGVQGNGIHIYDETTHKYVFWIGGEGYHSVADIIRHAHSQNMFVPESVIDELTEMDAIDLFISHKSEDVVFGKKIYDYLTQCGYSVFLSEISLPAIANADYSDAIDKALAKTKNLVLIASSIENINSGWVKYEWSSFANEKLSGRKSGNIMTITYNSVSIESLPYMLRQYQVIPEKAYESIENYIVR
jgi:hypothetical protein